MEKMAVVAINTFGGADVLENDERPIPQPGVGEVRVRVATVSFNPIDLYWREGRLDNRLPVVLGRDFSGVVDCLGSGVEGWSVGDSVYGYQAGTRASHGFYAEFSCIATPFVARPPTSWNDAQISALPVAGLTAYACVKTKARIEPGQAVFVAGAAGAVGSMIVQLAKLSGADPIIATAGSDDSETYLVNDLGLKKSWIVRYDQMPESELVEAVQARNGGQPVRASFDTVGGAMKTLCFQVVEADGHVVSIVEEPADFPLNIWDEPTSPLSLKSLSFHFVEIGAMSRYSSPDRWARYRTELDWLTMQAESGAIKPPRIKIVGTLSAETARLAHQQLATRHAKGKLVMTMKALGQ
jgi:NADPH:quinone reductase